MLNGVKVLSFTHFLQGPSAVQILADLGADVVKIEPTKGAWERHWSGAEAYLNGVSVFFLLSGRNQRSLSVDLRSERGKEIVWRLIRDCDVIVENYRPGAMERLGFGYEKVSEEKPDLVYCSLSGYGTDGPYKDRAGQDLLSQAMSGLATITGRKSDPPTLVGSAVVDQHGGARGSRRACRPLRASGHGQGKAGGQQSAELGAGPADRTVHLPPQRTPLRPQRDGRLLAVPPGALRHLRDGRRLHLHLAYAGGEVGPSVRGRYLLRVDRGGSVPQKGRGERPHSGIRQDEIGGALVWGVR